MAKNNLIIGKLFCLLFGCVLAFPAFSQDIILNKVSINDSTCNFSGEYQTTAIGFTKYRFHRWDQNGANIGEKETYSLVFDYAPSITKDGNNRLSSTFVLPDNTTVDNEIAFTTCPQIYNIKYRVNPGWTTDVSKTELVNLSGYSLPAVLSANGTLKIKTEESSNERWAFKATLSSGGSTILVCALGGEVPLLAGLAIDTLITALNETVPDKVPRIQSYVCKPRKVEAGQTANVEYGIQVYKHLTTYSAYLDNNPKDGVADGNPVGKQIMHVENIRAFAMYTITDSNGNIVLN